MFRNRFVVVLTFALIFSGILYVNSLKLKNKKGTWNERTDEDVLRDIQRESISVGDMLYLKTNTDSRTARATSKTWPNKIIPYIISENATDFRNVIQNAIAYIERYSCVRFRLKQSSDRYWVRFLKDPNSRPGKACSAYVGFLNRTDQGVMIGPRCVFGSMVHELLHTLGFEHEHNRNDRGSFIRMNDNNIDDNAKSQYLIECRGNTPQCTYDDYRVPYNYDSIMHYCTRCGSNGNGPCFTVLNNTNALGSARRVGQREGFSRGDWLMLNRRYNCPINENQAPPPLSDEPTIQDESDIEDYPTEPIDEITEGTTSMTTIATSQATTTKSTYCSIFPFSPGC